MISTVYISIHEILDIVPSVHKELSSTVECILSNTVSEILLLQVFLSLRQNNDLDDED